MKRKIIVAATLLFAATGTTAQTNYYPNTSGSITRPEFVYMYQKLKIAGYETPDLIELSNAGSSPYRHREWGYKDGSQMPLNEVMGTGNTPAFSDSSLTIARTLALVNNCFSAEQKAMLQGKSMFIELRIDSSTGMIADVYFSFSRNEPFVNIPVETYWGVEVALKRNLSVTVTPYGRKLTYIQLFWNQEF